MQRTNQFGGYKGIGTGAQRNFGGQSQYQQPHGNYPDRQEEEEVVEWLNIMITGKNGERKKLGKGIPLRESNPLERAIINMLYDPQTGERYADPDISMLFSAMVLECRPAGRVDDEFEIGFDFGDAATAAPEKKPQTRRAAVQEKQEDLIDDDIPEELQAATEKPASQRTGRRLGATKK